MHAAIRPASLVSGPSRELALGKWGIACPSLLQQLVPASPARTGASSRREPGPAQQTQKQPTQSCHCGTKGKAPEQVPLDLLGRTGVCLLEEDEERALTGPGGFSTWASLSAPLSQLVGGMWYLPLGSTQELGTITEAKSISGYFGVCP